MQWLHWPIRDQGIPDAAFERRWVSEEGVELRQRLQAGEDVLLHCMGGLGRTGTIAARLLVDAGLAPDVAIQHVRSARPGAIENES